MCGLRFVFAPEQTKVQGFCRQSEKPKPKPKKKKTLFGYKQQFLSFPITIQLLKRLSSHQGWIKGSYI